MTSTPPDLVALIGSRICHDLISPLSAIGNGVELLTMSGQPPSPEMELIEDSIQHANARVRFFRMAFGNAGPEESVAAATVQTILSGRDDGARIALDWQIQGDSPRPRIKLAFLALMCAETALAYGGRITLRAAGDAWELTAEGRKLSLDPDLWKTLSGGPVPAIGPAQVQFLLLPAEAARHNRPLTVSVDDTHLSISF